MSSSKEGQFDREVERLLSDASKKMQGPVRGLILVGDGEAFLFRIVGEARQAFGEVAWALMHSKEGMSG